MCTRRPNSAFLRVLRFASSLRFLFVRSLVQEIFLKNFAAKRKICLLDVPTYIGTACAALRNDSATYENVERPMNQKWASEGLAPGASFIPAQRIAPVKELLKLNPACRSPLQPVETYSRIKCAPGARTLRFSTSCVLLVNSSYRSKIRNPPTLNPQRSAQSELFTAFNHSCPRL